MVSTSPGLGLDRNSSYRGEFCISFFFCYIYYFFLPLFYFYVISNAAGKGNHVRTAQINLLNFFVPISKSKFSLFISSFIYYLYPFLNQKTQSRFLCLVLFVKFFVIGHDCAHKSFSKNKLLEDIVGTLAFLPLIYPYEPWRFKHDRHHAKTNMLVKWPLSIYFASS